MQRITWFKDQFGEVYIWNKEVIPCINSLDSADFSIESNESALKIIAPDANSAEENEWGWEDIPFVLTCTNEGYKRVGEFAYV